MVVGEEEAKAETVTTRNRDLPKDAPVTESVPDFIKRMLELQAAHK